MLITSRKIEYEEKMSKFEEQNLKDDNKNLNVPTSKILAIDYNVEMKCDYLRCFDEKLCGKATRPKYSICKSKLS